MHNFLHFLTVSSKKLGFKKIATILTRIEKENTVPTKQKSAKKAHFVYYLWIMFSCVYFFFGNIVIFRSIFIIPDRVPPRRFGEVEALFCAPPPSLSRCLVLRPAVIHGDKKRKLFLAVYTITDANFYAIGGERVFPRDLQYILFRLPGKQLNYSVGLVGYFIISPQFR